MSVEPGFGGQSFKEIALDKIKDLATRRKENSAHYLIEVDGINATTGKQCKDAGVDVLVAGSYVFNSDDCTQRIASLNENSIMCNTFRKDDTSSRQRIHWGGSWCGRIVETRNYAKVCHRRF